MFIGNPFAHFDPKNDTFEWDRLNDIATRARAILRHRCREEIEYAALVADWMLSEEAIADLPAPEVAGQAPTAAYASPAQLLRLRMVLFDITGLEELPNATWPEIIAAFALGCLSEAARISGPSLDLGDHDDDLDDAQNAPNVVSTGFWLTPDELALEAMETMCFAEALSGKLPEIEALIERKAANKISVHNRNAGLKRHAKQGAVTQRFVAEYLAGRLPGKSCADAATRFYQALPDEERDFYRKSNAERTLCDAVSRTKKQNNKSAHDYTKK